MTRIDRRALFTSGAAAALLAASGLSAQSRPRRGGRLRLALAREGDSLGMIARGAAFDTLIELAPDGTLRGELATDWTSDATAQHWVLTLREGVTFHDGAAFSATDAARMLRRHGIAAQAETAIRLTIALDQGDPQFPFRLTRSDMIVRDADDSPLNGTGLYRIARFEDGRYFRATRVADHYKGDTAGWAETIDAIAMSDPRARAAALRDDYVDVAELPEASELPVDGDLRYHPSRDHMLLAARPSVGLPSVIGQGTPLDDGRLAERWWLV